MTVLLIWFELFYIEKACRYLIVRRGSGKPVKTMQSNAHASRERIAIAPVSQNFKENLPDFLRAGTLS